MEGVGLSDDDIVLRAGQMVIRDLELSIQTAAEKRLARGQGVEYSLSATAAHGSTPEHLMKLGQHPHSTVRLSNVAAVRAAGWEVEVTDQETGHASMYLAAGKNAEPTSVELTNLRRAFDEPIENLHPKVKG